MNNNLYRSLSEVDPEIATAIDNEARRQHEGLELIGSENFVSEAVLEAAGSCLPTSMRRDIPGNAITADASLPTLSKSWRASGSRNYLAPRMRTCSRMPGRSANRPPTLPSCSPATPFSGLNLAHGGHLTHGHHLNFSGKTYRIVPYGVTRETETIDYDELEKIADDRAPKADYWRRQRVSEDDRLCAHAPDRGQSWCTVSRRYGALRGTGGGRCASVSGAARAHRDLHHAQDAARAALGHDPVASRNLRQRSTKSFSPDFRAGRSCTSLPPKPCAFSKRCNPSFREYARQVVANAKVLAETLADDGFRIMSGGTDTHLMLVDVFAKGMFGSEAEKALGEAGITVNKNAIPFDTNPPMKPSGIRIGTPALTTRGMKEPEMRQIAHWISEALDHRTDAAALAKVRKQVLGIWRRSFRCMPSGEPRPRFAPAGGLQFFCNVTCRV